MSAGWDEETWCVMHVGEGEGMLTIWVVRESTVSLEEILTGWDEEARSTSTVN